MTPFRPPLSLRPAARIQAASAIVRAAAVVLAACACLAVPAAAATDGAVRPPPPGPAVIGPAAPSTRPLRLGVPHELRTPGMLQTIPAVRDALRGVCEVEILWLSEPEARAEAEAGRLDVLFTSAAVYRQLLRAGAHDLATFIPRGGDDASGVSASVVFALADRDDLNEIEDLEGGTVLVSDRFYAFGIDRVVAEYLVRRREAGSPVRLRPGERPFDVITERGPLEFQLERLKSGDADAIILPACLAETAAEARGLDPGLLKTLSPRTDPRFLCAHSTKPAPALTLVSFPSLSADRSTRLLRRVLELRTPEGFRWAAGADYSAIDRDLRELCLDAWVEDRRPSWGRFFAEHRRPIIVAALVVLLLVANVIALQIVVRRRTRALREALEEQRRLTERIEAATDRMRRMRRIGLLGHFTSLFAHELRQPLNAIVCYAHGAKRLIAAGELERAEAGVEGIARQAEKAAEIVAEVRRRIQSRSAVRATETGPVVRRAAAGVAGARPGCLTVTVRGEESLRARVDPFDFEIALVNLLRNAAEAQEGLPDPRAVVEIAREGDRVRVTVTDDGPEIPPETFGRIVEIGGSTKAEGLGLGLGIVRTLIENNGGDVVFRRREAVAGGRPGRSGGLEVTLLMPAVPPEGDPEAPEAPSEDEKCNGIIK